MSIKQHQPQSPLKKSNKKSSEADHDDSPSKKNNINTSKSPFMTQGQKINFESEDSDGSDVSYESSIESQDDINIGQIQYFKEEMGRFFINYPELINHDILDYRDQDSGQDSEMNFTQGVGDYSRSNKLNKNWGLISDQILTEAKDSCSFLESLSHRIALYRSKIHHEDLIDVLLREEKTIMKEIELQINLKKKQNKGVKNTMVELAEGAENVYFSWRKKKQIENKMNLHREETHQEWENPKPTNSPHLKSKTHKSTFRERANTLSNKKSPATTDHTKELLKKISDTGNTKASTFFLTTNENQGVEPALGKKISRTTKQEKSEGMNSSSPPVTRRPNSYSKSIRPLREDDRQKMIVEESQKENKSSANGSVQAQIFWKHLVNFEPRTEAGRQLCELIQRTNNPNDELGIRKTIMQFLVRNRQTVQNEIILKSTISQKIQKLYNDDSKQLLMFYPAKMTLGRPNTQKKDDSPRNDRQSGMMGGGFEAGEFESGGDPVKGTLYQGQSTENGLDLENRLFGEGEKFMHLLEDIVEGPLMKYWMMLQENKL